MGAREHRDVAATFDRAYERADESAPSWAEALPATSLALIDLLGVPPTGTVADVGGGDARLVDALLAKGFVDVVVVDLSGAALERTRARLGDDPRATLLVGDATTWRSPRPLACWHDRACLHFCTEDADRAGYFESLRASLGPRGAVVLGGFGPEGPTACSGYEVRRASAAQLAEELGAGFEVVEGIDTVHLTPWGAEQAFSWLAARARA